MGSSEFVEQTRQEAEAQAPLISARQQALPVEELIARVRGDIGISHKEFYGPGRRTAVSRARAGIAYLWIQRFGQQGTALARVLGLRPPTIYEAARHSQQEAAYWNLLMTTDFHARNRP